jgi:uncharacterized protein YxjI
MKQKLFALGDDFVIRNAQGEDAFFVDGKVFAIGHQLSFQDMSGCELAYIRQRLLSWQPAYELYRGGVLMAVVKKELFTLFHCTFEVDLPEADALIAEGDFTDHEYLLRRGERTVATVSKRWFQLTDTYGIDIDDHEDAVLLLASTVIIDMCCHADARA